MTTSLTSQTDGKPPAAPLERARWGHRLPRHRGAGWAAWLPDLLVVTAAPILAFFALGVARMSQSFMIDPYFYTAYAQHGRDIVTRYGSAPYYGVRVSFTLPAHALIVLFGDVGGFYVFRYLLALLAIGPSYLLMRRLSGRLAATVSTAVILCSPVIWFAWGTDYPDSAAVSYLLGGAACLFMPAPTKWRRAAWVVSAGVLLTLGLHCQYVVAAPVAAVVAGWLLTSGRREGARAILWLLLLAVCALLTTAVLVVLTKWIFGFWNIIEPQLAAARHFRQPDQIVQWHSETWRWIQLDSYLLVPLAAIGAWMASGRRRTTRPEESGLVLVLALQVVGFTALQFLGRVAMLEWYFYSDLLWPVTCLVTALVLVRLGAPLRGRRWAVIALPLVVVLVTRVLAHWSTGWIFWLWPVGVVLALSCVAVVVLTRTVRRALPSPRWLAAVLPLSATAAITGLLFTMTVSKDVYRPPFPGQANLPTANYAVVFGHDDGSNLDSYRVYSRLHKLVPTEAGQLLTWSPLRHSQTVNRAAAQYLWHINSLGDDLPNLNAADRAALATRRPVQVVMLSDTGAEFGAGLGALRQDGLHPIPGPARFVSAGQAHMWLQVVSVTVPAR